MSYDLAVWDGDRPAGDEAASDMFNALCQRYLDSDDRQPPTRRISAYVHALLDRYPDFNDPAGDDSPWSTAPLIHEAVGPLIYLPMVWSRSEEVSAWAAQLAAHHGLVCYDPQLERLRP